jgi:hypothetical protein
MKQSKFSSITSMKFGPQRKSLFFFTRGAAIQPQLGA